MERYQRSIWSQKFWLERFEHPSQIKVNEIFSDNAELDYITNEKPITVSDISHEAVIEVTSNGTEGAAATGMNE